MNFFRFRQLGMTLPLAAACLLSAASAQKYTPPPPPLDAPCKPTKKDPCTPPPSVTPPPAGSSLAFPFPGDTSDAVKLDPNARPDDPDSKPASNPPAAGKDSSGKFPFPGDAPVSSSSSSNSASGAADADDDDPPAPAPANRRKLPKVENLDEREAKDIDVSSYYYSTGDFLAAYNRGKDAVKLMPQDPEAHFALAQAASKLKKAEEAREEYKLSLKLDVAEKHAKIAQAELARLH